MKYPGSKWSIANWIISFFPPHHTYLEPFFGSGAVLFKKPRSNRMNYEPVRQMEIEDMLRGGSYEDRTT